MGGGGSGGGLDGERLCVPPPSFCSLADPVLEGH